MDWVSFIFIRNNRKNSSRTSCCLSQNLHIHQYGNKLTLRIYVAQWSLHSTSLTTQNSSIPSLLSALLPYTDICSWSTEKTLRFFLMKCRPLGMIIQSSTFCKFEVYEACCILEVFEKCFQVVHAALNKNFGK